MADAAATFHLPLLTQYLQEQQELTAVERFSNLHDKDGATPRNAPVAPVAPDVPGAPAQEQYYRHLLPATPPGPGQQYAFEVDLDRCSGCKACVTACHSLNGLDETETWRSVGLLHGGSAVEAIQQTVTTACHHCVDPACMIGCPVKAYEKDPITGIVKHLDDQCIGCQYCVLTCPYEVPQYNNKKGIVRKCDLCSDRLEVGEAPACVQACPTEAIAIKVVSEKHALEDAQAGTLIPGAPSSAATAPTTNYKTRRAFPKNMLPADFYAQRPGHQHMPLVVMLVLTQLSVGAFIVEFVANHLLTAGATASSSRYHALVAVALGLLAIGASTFHLGRPRYAYRAVLGVRTSWLSREILAFGAFAGAAILYSAALWQAELLPILGLSPWSHQFAAEVQARLGIGVSATGLAGVICSVMLYRVTRRAYWAGLFSIFKFTMTALVLGLATTLVTTTGASLLFGNGTLSADAASLLQTLGYSLAAATTAKLAYESSIFIRLRDKQLGDLKRTALLLKGDLHKENFWRFVAGGSGGIFIPLLILGTGRAPSATGAFVAATLSFVLCLIGEFLERRLFFTAVSAPRMPGGVA